MPAAEEGLGAPVPLRAPTPCHRLSSGGGLLTLPSPSWAAGRAPSSARRPCSAAPADPRHTLGNQNLVRSRRWDPDPQRRTRRPACCSRLAPRPNPRKRLLLAGQAWAATLWRHLAAPNFDAQGRHGPGPGRRKPNSLASAAAAVPFGSAHRRLRSNALVARNQPGERCCQQRCPGPSRALAAAVEAGPRPRTPLPRGSPSPGPLGARAGRSGRRSARPAVSRAAKPQAHGRSQRPEPWRRMGDGAGSPGPASGNQPAVNQPARASMSWPWPHLAPRAKRSSKSPGRRKRLLALSRAPAASLLRPLEATRPAQSEARGVLTLLDRLPGPVAADRPGAGRRAHREAAEGCSRC